MIKRPNKIPLSIIKQHLAPQHLLSRFAGLMANCKIPAIKNYLIQDFVKRYQVNMGLAQEENPLAYSCFNDFFTRQLKPEYRPINKHPNSIVCPVDGCVQNSGKILQGQLIQAKQHTFNVTELIGGDNQTASAFEEGEFITLYLSPKDYHRIHMPLTGTLTDMWYVPGRLFSVNLHTANHIPKLFARNERVVARFETDIGPMILVLVGAMIVGSIHTTWAGCVAPQGSAGVKHWKYDENKIYSKGTDMGHFTLGSTVIVLLPKKAQLDSGFTPGKPVIMGEKLGFY